MSGLAGVVLAAGRSSRMGTPKALLELGGRSALCRVVKTLWDAGCGQVRVVVGHNADVISPKVRALKSGLVVNPRYDDGMFSSVCAGIAGLESHSAVFVWPVDVPLVRAATLKAMADALAQQKAGAVVLPRAGGPGGRCGHPPLIAGSLLPRVLAWRGGGGLRGALGTLPKAYVDTDDQAVLWDMDTPADYIRLKAALAQRNPEHFGEVKP